MSDRQVSGAGSSEVLAELRRLPRLQFPTKPKVVVELSDDENVQVRVVDAHFEGACLLFDGDPKVAVGQRMTVRRGQTRTSAEVRFVAQAPGGWRVGVAWSRDGNSSLSN